MFKFREATRTAALSAAALIVGGGLAGMALATPAGAATLTSADGSIVLNTGSTAMTPGTPYSSGQTINIVMTNNAAFSQANMDTFFPPSGADPIKFEECDDYEGLASNLPTAPGDCDGNTLLSNADLEFDGTTGGSDTFTSYTVYALPNDVTFDEPAAQTTVCGVAPNYCVIGIFSNQSIYSDPHAFSAPFQVLANADDGGENPGDGTPEAPFAIALPLAAGLTGGALMFRRRRRNQHAA